MPNYGLFGCTLIIIGLSAQTFTTTCNVNLQLSTDPNMRGRVIALFLAIAVGATPIGAPLVGWVADTFGPRWALMVGAASGFARGRGRVSLPGEASRPESAGESRPIEL